jgi:hypothetical protein
VNASATPRWLLLAHQLPAKPSNARVKAWRRLQQVGAVQARSAVYVLPNSEQCREDFEWIRADIVAMGGEAIVFAADTVNREGDAELVEMFRRARDADYDAIARAAGKAASTVRRGGTRAPSDAAARVVRQLRERYTALRAIDFFHAPRGDAAGDALTSLEERLAGPVPSRKESAVRASRKEFSNRRWVTRPRPGIDRMGSAWLIRRFIDPKATFGFVERPSSTEVPFDMYEGAFSHQGDRCTFEVLAAQFDISDPVVDRLAQIVHDLDMKENRYGAPEAPAVGRMVDGLRQMHADDAALLEQGMAMFEALSRSLASGVETRRTTRRGKKRGPV